MILEVTGFAHIMLLQVLYQYHYNIFSFETETYASFPQLPTVIMFNLLNYIDIVSTGGRHCT